MRPPDNSPSAETLARLDHFLKTTTPPSERPANGPAPAPPEGPASEENPPSTGSRKKHATKQQMLERLTTIRRFLIDCVPMEQILTYARKTWDIGCRSVQLYIKRIRDGWAREAMEADYLAHLWQARREAEQHIYYLNRLMSRTEDPRVQLQILRTLDQIERRRDALLARAVEHRVYVRRDVSPDSRQATHRRRGLVVMQADELFARVETLRQEWERGMEAEGWVRASQGPPAWADAHGVKAAADPGKPAPASSSADARAASAAGPRAHWPDAKRK